MKKLLFISLFFFSIGSLRAGVYPFHTNNLFCNNYADTATFSQSELMAIDIASFSNRTVNEFLAALDVAVPGYVLSRVYGGHSMRMASCLNVYFKNGLNFVIIVTEFTHLQQFNADSQWDVNLFRQETIASIEFHKNGQCLTGCPN